MFIGEYDAQPVAECWLQEMNIAEPLAQYPGLDLRRIDLGIGEKDLWGQGMGTRIIALLPRLAFGLGIRDDNERSLRAFAKNGYAQAAKRAREPNAKSRYEIDMVIDRAVWRQSQRP